MKVGIYGTTTDGAKRFLPYKEKYDKHLELIDFGCSPTFENLDKIKEYGCEALIYFNPKHENPDYFEKMAKMGVRYLCTSSAGYDHFNLESMKEHGIKGANVPQYSPNAISEHTVLLMLSVLRNYREQIKRIEKAEYSFDGLMGKEIRNQVIGIVGTGRIGCTTVECLTGFKPKKIMAYSLSENPRIKNLVTYTDQDTLYKSCDVIIFHCAATADNYHMVNEESIAKMKDGVILINAARGSLFDTKAVLNAVKNGKIGGLGIDVIEGEEKLRGTQTGLECPVPELSELLKYPNVTFTRHTAFYTDEAYKNMTETTIDNLLEYESTGSCENELVK